MNCVSDQALPEGIEDPRCVLVRNDAALIVAAEGAVREVLGWSADELIGLASTSLIHPEDQASAVGAWFEMLAEPGATKAWRGRYRSGDGIWQWVEASNTNLLDDPNDPRVESSIVRVAVDQVGIAEELRARKQLLSQLSDALPVGLFQLDLSRRVTFTNDRLHAIIGSAPAATADAQFASVLGEDRDCFDAALSAVLSDQPVDDLEIRFVVASPNGNDATTRVGLVSLRSLSDDTGAVSGAIGCLSDVTDSVRLRRELELRASVDALTGCLNRDATLELLELHLRGHGDMVEGVAVAYVDLDDFKHVNDCHGHATGDAVLVAAVECMQAVLRHDDRVGRVGGDEFLVVCPHVTGRASAAELAQRVRDALHTTVAVGNVIVQLRASVGLAWTDRPCSADALIAIADDAMYRTKPARRAARAG
jgi:diguanylate cyclase (GGDEF)-like protein/PAS domain S-box-containing protein